MEKGINELSNKLEKYSDFSKESNIEHFLETVDQIILSGDQLVPDLLLKYFDDDTMYSWVFEEIGHSLEYLPMECYVSGILSNLKKMSLKAKGWSKDLLYPIFNDEVCYRYFKKNLSKGDSVVLKNRLLEIKKESSAHVSQVEETLKLL